MLNWGIRRGFYLAGILMAMVVLTSLASPHLVSLIGFYRAHIVAEEVAKAVSMAQAQANGFGVPFTVELPKDEVVCDGHTITVFMETGNSTVVGSAALPLAVKPFRAKGGELIVYPGGEVRVAEG